MLKASLDGDGVAGPQRRDKYSEGTGTRGYGSVLGGWHSEEASTAYGGGQRVSQTGKLLRGLLKTIYIDNMTCLYVYYLVGVYPLLKSHTNKSLE